MKSYIVRLLHMLLGLVLYGFGIILTMQANIGYAPWEVFHAGMSIQSGMSIGVASIVAGIVIVIAVTVLGEKLGLGTLGSMILTGVFMDVILWFRIIPAANSLVSGIAMLITGLFVLALGSYYYMKSGFGVGPRDNLMVVLTRMTGIPVGVCRGAVELLVTFTGWLMGGMVGLGTILSMLSVGFCIEIVFKLLRFDVTAVEHETLNETFAAFSHLRSR